MSFSTVLLPAPERPVRNTISPLVDAEADIGERLAPVRIAFADAIEDDHACRLAFAPPRRARRQRPGVELAEVLGLLADADEADREPELARDGDDDAALGGAVELG